MRLKIFGAGRGRRDGLHESASERWSRPDLLVTRINESLRGITAQIQRMNLKYRELEQLGKEYFNRCVEDLIKGDEAHAKIYVDEIAEIRRLARIILHTQLVMEQVKIRLESILELTDVMGLVTSLRGIIGKVMEEVTGIAPEAAANLQELSKQIDEFVNTSGQVTVGEPSPAPELSDEASKIFEDARKIIAMRLKESFPDVPIMTETEKLVYSYISKLDPEHPFNAQECSLQLGIPEEQIEDALDALQRKGIIEVTEAEAEPA